MKRTALWFVAAALPLAVVAGPAFAADPPPKQAAAPVMATPPTGW